MRKLLTLGIIFLLLASIFIPISQAQARGAHNINTGKIFSTIQAAIDDADTKNGHTITVDPGIYVENIIIHKSISLIGEDPSTTIINGNGAHYAIKVGTNNVIITNFTITNAEIGIDVSYRAGTCIFRCNIINTLHGIELVDSLNNSVSVNNLLNNRQSINVLRSSGNNISENNISNNEVGVVLVECSNNLIFRNNISNNKYREYVSPGCGMYIRNSLSNRIYQNNFINNDQHLLYYSSSNVFNSPSPITFTYQDKTYTSYLGNYWNDYAGIDSDKDGIGDTPYNIDSDKDNYPLMQPFENYVEEVLPSLEVELVSPPDGARATPPMTFRARITSGGQPVKDAFVTFYAGNGGTRYAGQPNIRTDYQGYAEANNWDPEWDHEVTFRWWAEAWKEGYRSGSSEKRSLTYIPYARAGWPTFMQNSQHTGYTREDGPDTLNVIWRTLVGELGEYVDLCASVVVANGRAYAIFGRTLFCFDARTGEHLWIGKKLLVTYSVPFIKDDRIYALTWDNSIICFNAYNGDVLWEVFIPAEYGRINEVFNSLTITNDKVYVKSFGVQGQYANDYACVLCFDINTRSFLWSVNIGRSNFASPSPVTVYDEKVYVIGGFESFLRSSYDDVIYCIDAYSGNILWKRDLPYPSHWDSALIASGKSIYVSKYVSGQGYSLTCLDASTGNVIWDGENLGYVFEIICNLPSVAYRNVYFSTNDGIYCFNAESGKLIWKNKDFHHVWTPFAVAAGKIYICECDGIVALDAITGNTICRFQAKFLEPCAPAITNGKIYVAVISAEGAEAKLEILCLGQLDGYPANVIDAEKVLIKEFTTLDGKKVNEYVLISIYTKKASEDKIAVYVELNTVFEYWDKGGVNVEYVDFDDYPSGGFVKGYMTVLADEDATILWNETTLWIKSEMVEGLLGTWYYTDISYYGDPGKLKKAEEKVTVLPGGKDKIIIYEGGNIAPAFYLRWRGDIPYNEWKSNYRFDILGNKIIPGLGEVIKSLTTGSLPVIGEIIDMAEILECFIEEQPAHMLLDDDVINDVPNLNHYDFVARSWDASGREWTAAPICTFSSVVMEVPIKIDPAKTHRIRVRGKVLPYDCPYDSVLFAKNFEVNLFKESTDPLSASTPFKVSDFTNGQWSILDEKEREFNGERVKFTVCVFSPNEDQQTKYIFIEISSLTQNLPLRGGFASIIVDEKTYVDTNIMAAKYLDYDWEEFPHDPPFVVDRYPAHYHNIPEGNRKIVKAYINLYLFIISKLPKVGKIFGAIKTMFDLGEYLSDVMELKEIVEGFANDAELDEYSCEWGSGGIYNVESRYCDVIIMFPVKFYSIEDKFIVRSNVEMGGEEFGYSGIFKLKETEKQHVFNITWKDISYPVVILTNSSLKGFTFNQSLKQISFNISGITGTFGFCNVTLPKALIEQPYIKVLFDGRIIDFTLSENKNSYHVYIIYQHSEHTITINFAQPSPSWLTYFLQLWILLLMFVIGVAILVMLAKRRRVK